MNYDDERELDEVPPSEPAGSVPVSFSVPVPTIEQVCGQVARQIIADAGYKTRHAWELRMQEAIDKEIDRLIAQHATAVLEAALHQPLQPTDGFGKPTGDPTDLARIIHDRVSHWANDTVNRDGKVSQGNSYDKAVSRLEWLLGQIISHDLTSAVDKQVREIAATLKGQAAALIAKQIGEKVASVVLK